MRHPFIAILFIAFTVCAFPVPSNEVVREDAIPRLEQRSSPDHVQAEFKPISPNDQREHAVQVMIAARDIGKDEKQKSKFIKLFKEHSAGVAKRTDLGFRVCEKVDGKPYWIENVKGVHGEEPLEAFNSKLENLENHNLRLLRWWWLTEEGSEGYIIYYVELENPSRLAVDCPT